MANDKSVSNEASVLIFINIQNHNFHRMICNRLNRLLLAESTKAPVDIVFEMRSNSRRKL